jgi:hypothetical protein
MNKLTYRATKHFVVHVVGCTDPELVGPYTTSRYRDNKARFIRNDKGNDEDGVFWLNVSNDGRVEIGAYSNGFIEGKKGF